MFNDEAYIKELTDYINKLNIDSVLEVGCLQRALEGLTVICRLTPSRKEEQR